MVVHVCNHSYLGDRDLEGHSSWPPQAKSCQNPISTKAKRDGGGSSNEPLTSKTPVSQKKRKQRRRKSK
jgi:hypothetical protein